jgi:hypothetical protein
MTVAELCMAAGVPSAIVGIFVWYFKRYVEKRDEEARKREEAREEEYRKREEKREKEIEERERNTEKLMMLIMQDCHATYILADATARAVQRIPDAKCNGDMKSALEKAGEIQKREQSFLMDLGVKHIFGD